MKNFVKFFGMIALIAVIGFALVGCDTGNGGGGGGENSGSLDNGPITSVTIIGLSDYNGWGASINIYDTDANYIAHHAIARSSDEDIVNGSVTLILKDNNNAAFTTAGSYRVEFEIDDNVDGYKFYTYTNGKSLAQLGITSEADMIKFPKYNFSGDVSITFNQFLLLGE